MNWGLTLSLAVNCGMSGAGLQSHRVGIATTPINSFCSLGAHLTVIGCQMNNSVKNKKPT